MKIAISAAALLVASFAYGQISFDGTFDSLDLGGYDSLAADGWTLRDRSQFTVSVVADPTGGSTAFSGNVLAITAAPSSLQMRDFLTNAGITQPSDDFSFSFDFWQGPVPGGATNSNKEELFVRFASWSLFGAVKPFDDVVEGNGNQVAPAPALETVNNLKFMFDVDGASIVGYDLYLNDAFVMNIDGLDLTLGSLELRSGKSPAFIDNITVEVIPEPSTYALIGLGALAIFVLMRRRL